LKKREVFMASLRKVLIAYSNVDTEIGYVQGMSFMAGMFVCHQEEELAFWSFYGLMCKGRSPYREFFLPGFPKLKEMIEIVDYLLVERYRVVYDALRAEGMNSIILCPGWFNACFLSSELDPGMAECVWDQFLAFGVAPLLSLGMAAVSFMPEVLETEGFGGFLAAATNAGQLLAVQPRGAVNLAWVKEWITPARYAELRRTVLQDR
jgi:hypothetical protein